jgi:hypothetical protein
MYLIDWMTNLNRSWPFIFIWWGGLTPQGNSFTSLIYQGSSIWLGIGEAPVWPVKGTGQTGAPGVLILVKSYLPHRYSDLGVPHMDFDLLDETYQLVKSKLYFVDIDHTGLTGGPTSLAGRMRPANFVCEHMPLVFLAKDTCEKICL